MKKAIISFLVAIIAGQVLAQGTGINIGFDPKIAFFGTDNQYTKHHGIPNFQIKLEHLDESCNIYAAIGVEYANLREWYLAEYLNLGYAIPMNLSVFRKDFTTYIIPQFEGGLIQRENITVDENDLRGNPTSFYLGGNLALRISINDWLSLETQGSLKLGTDITGKLIRPSGYVSAIYKF